MDSGSGDGRKEMDLAFSFCLGDLALGVFRD